MQTYAKDLHAQWAATLANLKQQIVRNDKPNKPKSTLVEGKPMTITLQKKATPRIPLKHHERLRVQRAIEVLENRLNPAYRV